VSLIGEGASAAATSAKTSSGDWSTIWTNAPSRPADAKVIAVGIAAYKVSGGASARWCVRIESQEQPALVIAEAMRTIAPPLLRQALAQSPGSTFRFDGWSDTVYLDAERGALDIVFTFGAAPPPLRSEPLFEDNFSCLLSSEHPLARAAKPTLDAYLDCDHVIINIAEGRQGAVDIRLGALGRPRRANVTVPYNALAAAVVQDTNLIATLPNRLLDALTIPAPLSVIPAPAEIGPVSFSMASQPRLDNDPAQQWLRETIRSATSSDPTYRPGVSTKPWEATSVSVALLQKPGTSA